MDLLGGLIISFVTAYGGGTLRDLLLGVRPVNWLNDYVPLFLVVAGTAVTFFVKDVLNRIPKTLFVFDAIGLGLFTTLGINLSLAYGVNEVYAIILGVMTATFGGMLADVLCNKVPELLRKGELYATACAIGAVVYVVLGRLGLPDVPNLVLCTAIIVVIRFISRKKNISLPEI